MKKFSLFVTLLYAYIVPQSFKIGLIVICHPMTPPCQLMSSFQLPPPPTPPQADDVIYEQPLRLTPTESDLYTK